MISERCSFGNCSRSTQEEKVISFAENARLYEMDDDTVDQIFDFMVRDFSKYALQLYSKPSATSQQMELCMKMIRKPAVDADRFGRVWQESVYSLGDSYEMKP